MFAGVEILAGGRVALIVEDVAPEVMSVSKGEGFAVTVGTPAARNVGCSEGLNDGFSRTAGAEEMGLCVEL